MGGTGFTMDAQYQLRFYEKDPSVKLTVDYLLAIPTVLKEIIGEGCHQIAQKDCSVEALLADVKQLGLEKLISLNMSKLKRRAYDHTSGTHNFLSSLLVLPPAEQRLLANKAMGLVNEVQDYLKLCKDHEITPQKELLEALVNRYVQTRTSAAHTLVKEQLRLQQTQPQSKKGLIPGATGLAHEESIQSAFEGLTIKKSGG